MTPVPSASIARLFRSSIIYLLIPSCVSVLCLSLLAWKSFQTLLARNESSNKVLASSLGAALQETVDRSVDSALLLTESKHFMEPVDKDRDVARFGLVSLDTARRMADRDGIVTWIDDTNSSAPLQPISRLPNDNIAAWKLARGLPFRGLSGTILAKDRRSLASRIMNLNPAIGSIAEFDRNGRVVYLVPYTSQVQLSTIHPIEPWIDIRSVSTRRVLLVFHRNFNHSMAGKSLSIVVVLPRPNDSAFLVLTLAENALDTLRQGFRIESLALLDDSRNLLLISGKASVLQRTIDSGEGEILRGAISVRGRAINFVGLPPRLRYPYELLWLFGWILLGILFSFAISLYLFRRSIQWVTREQNKRLRLKGEVEQIATGIVHDFRNKLEALRQLMGSISKKMNPEQRQRYESAVTFLKDHTEQIRDKLANVFSLPGVLGEAPTPVTRMVPTYLRGTLASVIHSVNTQWRHEIILDFEDNDGGEELFVAVPATEIERIVTNLVTNSTEACTKVKSSDIRIVVSRAGDHAKVRVVDNGCGIPLPSHSSIFEPNWGTKGKNRGNGLTTSLNLAKTVGASLSLVSSDVNKGTVFELTMRCAEAPVWFVNAIELTLGAVIVVVDDEGYIADYWEEQIGKQFMDERRQIYMDDAQFPEVIRITHTAALRSNFKSCLERGTKFLVDYKFENETTTGIELIEELGLQHKSILVTNLFDDPQVLDAVERLNILLMPKKYRFDTRFPIRMGEGE